MGPRKETDEGHLIKPLVVEVSAGASAAPAQWRRAARLLCPRPDLGADEL